MGEALVYSKRFEVVLLNQIDFGAIFKVSINTTDDSYLIDVRLHDYSPFSISNRSVTLQTRQFVIPKESVIGGRFVIILKYIDINVRERDIELLVVLDENGEPAEIQTTGRLFQPIEG